MAFRWVSTIDIHLLYYFIIVGVEAPPVAAAAGPMEYISIPFWGLALAYGVFVSCVLFLGMYICYLKEKLLQQQTDITALTESHSRMEDAYEVGGEEEEEVPDEAPSVETESIYDDVIRDPFNQGVFDAQASNEEEPIYEVVEYFEPFDRRTIYEVVDPETIYEEDFEFHCVSEGAHTRRTIYSSSINGFFDNPIMEQHRF